MAADRVRSRRLSVAAQSDVDEIWFHSAKEWSNEQADRYLTNLYNAFDTLMQHPFLAREREETVPPVRLYPYRSHLIAYRVDGSELVIVRVLHVRQNWRAILNTDQS